MASQLAELSGAELDRAGRVTVEPDLTLPGHPEVLALGDMVLVRSPDGGVQALPGVAPVAMQQGRYAAKLIRARLSGHSIGPFRYRDKGYLATGGRARAVAALPVVGLNGFPAVLGWVRGHLACHLDFQNRLLLFSGWFNSCNTHDRGARLIAITAADE